MMTDQAVVAVKDAEPAESRPRPGRDRGDDRPVVEAVAPATPPAFDLDAPEWYLNRELTWLAFNRRVLHEAQDERTPLLPGQGGCRPDEWRVVIQRQGALTSVYYPHDPLDVVGWKGTLTVWQLNVRDIRPVLSDRYHLPPSAHTTFVAPNVAICTFAPRPLENGDPRALKVPFYHSNIDFDEVLFYHAGEFFSRHGIKPGMLTFHPQGIHHGPQRRATLRTPAAQRTEEVAVMIDTRRPLDVCEPAHSLEIVDYWKSWQPEDAR